MSNKKKSNKDIRHDLNSALTPIMGYAELLIARLSKKAITEDNAYVLDKLQRIHQQSQKIKEIVDTISDDE